MPDGYSNCNHMIIIISRTHKQVIGERWETKVNITKTMDCTDKRFFQETQHAPGLETIIFVSKSSHFVY